MKLFLVTLILVIGSCFNSIHGQSPGWLWAKGTGGTNYNSGTDVCEDRFGNVYMSGNFQSLTLNFGSTMLTNSGLSDIFVVKYDSNGNELWALKVGDTDQDISHSIATDSVGNIIITGVFYSSSLTFGSFTLVNSGIRDMFVAKLNSNGTFLWAKNALGFNFDFGYDVAVDNDGNIFVTGEYNSGVIVFDTIALNNVGGEDLFVVKYDPAGNVVWAKSAGGIGSDAGFGISVDNSGNVFVTGHFYSNTLTFDSITLINSGDRDYFVIKFDSMGHVQWANSGNGSGSDYGYKICNDSAGSVYVTGGFASPTLVIGSNVLTGNGNEDPFNIKYDSNGNVVWTNSFGGTYAEVGTGIAINDQGFTFVTGRFSSPFVTIGTDTLFNTTPLLAEAFIACYDAIGVPVWAKSINGTLVENITGVFCNDDGYIYISGGFQSIDISFGSITLFNANGNDGFIAKLDNVINTGFNDGIVSNNFVVSPNPFITHATISLNSKFADCDFRIFDVFGNVLRFGNFRGDHYILHKDQLKPGMYFLQLSFQHEKSTFTKIIVQ